MIDFDDELERAQARLKRQGELVNTAVLVGQIGEPYQSSRYGGLSAEDKALFDAWVSETKVAFDQLVEGAARLAELFTEIDLAKEIEKAYVNTGAFGEASDGQ